MIQTNQWGLKLTVNGTATVVGHRVDSNLFRHTLGLELGDFPRMKYDDAMRFYGSDKPDLRFDMVFVELNEVVKNKGFSIFDEAELIIGIKVPGKADMTRKQIDELTDWVKRPQIGAKG